MNPFVVGLLWGAVVFFICDPHEVPTWKQLLLIIAGGMLVSL